MEEVEGRSGETAPGSSSGWVASDLRLQGYAVRRRPGPQRVEEDPYAAILIVHFSSPAGECGQTGEGFRWLTGYWLRQVKYWEERQRYDEGVEWTRDGLWVDGGLYWEVREGSYLCE